MGLYRLPECDKHVPFYLDVRFVFFPFVCEWWFLYFFGDGRGAVGVVEVGC